MMMIMIMMVTMVIMVAVMMLIMLMQLSMLQAHELLRPEVAKEVAELCRQRLELES